MPLKAKAALATAIVIAVLFAGIEIYGLAVLGDWTVVNPTVACQLLAITVAVTPMRYGMIYASHHSD